MGFALIWKFRLVLFVSACLLLPSCSAITRHLIGPDITGCGDIKWGMTLAQVQTLFGTKARIETDPKSGAKLEHVQMTIGGIEQDGFLSTDAGTDHVSGVHFFTTGPSHQNNFNALKRNLVETYGAPGAEHMMTSGPLCFWQFPSGSVTLNLFRAQGDFKGGVSLAYIKNPLGLPTLH